jgi:hypothetical protein
MKQSSNTNGTRISKKVNPTWLSTHVNFNKYMNQYQTALYLCMHIRKMIKTKFKLPNNLNRFTQLTFLKSWLTNIKINIFQFMFASGLTASESYQSLKPTSMLTFSSMWYSLMRMTKIWSIIIINSYDYNN